MNDLISWILQSGHDDGICFGMINTNFLESLNSVLKDTRYSPITTLPQITFYRVNSWFVTKRYQVNKYIHEDKQCLPTIEWVITRNLEKAYGHWGFTYHMERQYFHVKIMYHTINVGYSKGFHRQVVNM